MSLESEYLFDRHIYKIIEKYNFFENSDMGFILACNYGHLSMVNYFFLRSHIAPMGCSLMLGIKLAIQHGRHNIVKFFIDNNLINHENHQLYWVLATANIKNFHDMRRKKPIKYDETTLQRLKLGSLFMCKFGTNLSFAFTDLYLKACLHGDINNVEFSIEFVTLHNNIQYGFNHACEYGHFDVIKFIYQYTQDHTIILSINQGITSVSKNNTPNIDIILFLLSHR